LPDARGERYLRAARERVAVQRPPAAVVALVRDAEDRLAASAAGILRTLEKPVDQAPLDELIARLPALGAVSA
jgi:DNA-binding response OmpR family regulator